MKFSELSAKDQRAIRSGSARPSGPKGEPGRMTRSRPSRRPGSPISHLCARCGETFAAYPPAERHADEHRARAVRIELVL